MAFTSTFFLFIVFPAWFATYYITIFLRNNSFLSAFLKKIRATDILMLIFCCAFYMWACFDDIFWLISYILLVYFFGFLIQKLRSQCLPICDKDSLIPVKYFSLAYPVLVFAVIVAVSILIYFKYTGLLARVWNYFLNDSISGKSIIAPLGISFITFSAISYLADIFLRKADSGSLLDCALYLTFFPKIVSGPIVLWRDFLPQIGSTNTSLPMLSTGITRIMIGFAKKLILADTFGACIASSYAAIDAPSAFGFGLLYMLQIYYDFSGYSDIAIGLSNIFGYSVKENFNFPYLSCSITEFWQRWHISLGTWFREYIYFPLGGSKKGKLRTSANVGLVFLLTGLWHGAGFTFIFWGIINGLCNIAEKLLKNNKIYMHLPKLVKWAFTMTITYFCWGLFRANSFTAFKDWLLTLIGLKVHSSIPCTWQYYFDARIITLMIIGILGATVFGLPKVQVAYRTMTQSRYGSIAHLILLVLLFILSVIFMINSTYSPFIYFQF